METRHRDLDPGLFQSADIDTREGERIAGPPVGFWKDAWRRLKKNRGALVSLVILITVFALAFVIGATSGPALARIASRFAANRLETSGMLGWRPYVNALLAVTPILPAR